MRLQEGLDAGGSERCKELVRTRGLGSIETCWGMHICARGSCRREDPSARLGQLGCLRALTGEMHRVSARAHPRSASLLAGPGQPPLCWAGDSAAPSHAGGDTSLLRPVPARTHEPGWAEAAHNSSHPGDLGWAVSLQSTLHGHHASSAATAQPSPSAAPTSQQRQPPTGVCQSSSPASPFPGSA